MRKRTVWITSAAAAAVLIAGGTAVAFGAVDDLTSDDARESGEITAEELDAAVAAALDEVGPGTVIDADRDDDSTHAYEIDVLLDAGGRVEVKLDDSLNVVEVTNEDAADDSDGNGTDDTDLTDDSSTDDTGTDDSRTDDVQPVDAADADRAKAAALAHTGEGTVTEVDLSDDADHVWEVEVTLANGDDIDVELDANFAVTRAH